MREGKQILLNEIKQKIDDSKGFVLVSYQGLKAEINRDLRSKIADAKGEVEVVRKRLFVKALEESGAKLEAASLNGHIAIFFAKEDPLQLTKAAVDFADQYKENLSIMGGYIDSEVIGAQEVNALAKLPSLNQLRSQFIGLLQAPMSQTVSTVQAILSSILNCMEEKSKKS